MRAEALIVATAASLAVMGCTDPDANTAVPSGTLITPEYFAFAVMFSGQEGWRAVCIEADVGQTVALSGIAGVGTAGTCAIEVGMPIRRRDGSEISLAEAQRIAAAEANAAAYSVLQRARGYNDGVCHEIIAEMNRRLDRRVRGSTADACGTTSVSHDVPVVRWPGPVPEQPRDRGDKPGSTCETAMPELQECWELPGVYVYRSATQALRAVKVKTDNHALKLHNRLLTTGGPCPGQGYHYNVRDGRKREASIVCCDCCLDDRDGPAKEERCQIVW